MYIKRKEKKIVDKIWEIYQLFYVCTVHTRRVVVVQMKDLLVHSKGGTKRKGILVKRCHILICC